jgi:dolichol-phosphate mannosyltransferase
MTARQLISIVVPVHNERGNLARCYEETLAVTRTLPEYAWEFVFVDDGSRDGSFEVIESLRLRDDRIYALRFPRNFGSHVAIAAGIDYCHGDAAIIMAADLQDPPSLIPEFIARWQSGHDVVWGSRSGRDDGAVRTALMRAFYKMVRRYALPTYPENGTGSFCLITGPVIDAFRQCTERNRLTFGLIAWAGFRETDVPYHRPARLVGKSSWTPAQMVKAAIDTFVSFSFLPIRAISYFGLLVSFISFLAGIYVVLNKIFFGTRVAGWTSVMLAVLVIGGVQLVMLGVLGEYLWRILDESRRRPLYIVERNIGFGRTSARVEEPAATS